MLFNIAEAVVFAIGLIWLVQMVVLLTFLAREAWHEDRPRQVTGQSAGGPMGSGDWMPDLRDHQP